MPCSEGYLAVTNEVRTQAVVLGKTVIISLTLFFLIMLSSGIFSMIFDPIPSDKINKVCLFFGINF